jgi:hypothetical protein
MTRSPARHLAIDTTRRARPAPPAPIPLIPGRGVFPEEEQPPRTLRRRPAVRSVGLDLRNHGLMMRILEPVQIVRLCQRQGSF